MLVERVRDEQGRHITQHAWILLRTVTVKLVCGDEIRFSAEIELYTKGPRRHRVQDYGFCKPANIEHIR
jgi:hypothetical protein